MTDALDELLGARELGDVCDRLREAARATRVVGGWATVELDRAERELAARHGASAPVASETAPEPLLRGATARWHHLPDGGDALLLEPSREGLLAASLARYGEGVVAAYLVADPSAADRVRSAGFGLSSPAQGPLGPQRRVVIGPVWGPHVLLVDAGDRPAAATIER